MQLHHIKTMLAAGWVVSVVVASLALGITSSGGLVALAVFGLLPPLAMWRLWNHPRQTMSESIREGRR
jgi:hypothetical protein